MNTQEFDHIDVIRQRLRDAKAGRKRSGSIASLVEDLRNDIQAQRERGLTWQAIAEAILKDKSKQAAIRSAYQRLPQEPSGQAAETPPRKTRTKSAPPTPNQEAEEHQPPAKTTRFDMTPMTDSYGSDDYNWTASEEN